MKRPAEPRRLIWYARWGNPYTEPPNGQPRTLLELITDDSSHQTPPEISAAAPIGSGYAVWCTPITAPPRRMSQAGRAKLRRGNLTRRVTKQAPLFADAIIAQELAARPAYFAGTDYRDL